MASQSKRFKLTKAGDLVLPLLLSLLFPSTPLLSQPTPTTPFPPLEVTYVATSPDLQAALIGGHIKHVTVIGVEVCNTTSTQIVISSGRLYQAALVKGLELIPAAAVPAILTRTANHNPYRIALDIGGGTVAAGSVLMASKAIAASTPVITGITIAAEIYQIITPILSKNIPDQSTVLSNLLDGQIGLPPAACVSKIALASTGKLPPKPLILPMYLQGTPQ